MLLKSLELQGFKTFPDKTKLKFDMGMTSVVGPNGSGKSNISDAIRWVLGEQSPKSLRCSKMEDVVFNGTDKRKALGYAEVTLNIENKDRALQFDDDNVAITRRYYRSGESEYLINGIQVRLRDINELFMDTGLGRDGYSMIGQGKIDSIVASKSEDRREMFEEAAGISRYRYKKIEAERKLKHTEDNLLRLRDIVTELQDRVEPLRKQSEKAEKFLEYSNEKKDIEIALWVNTLNNSQKILKEQDDKISIAKLQYNKANETLENIQRETEEIYNNNAKYSVEIDEIRRKISNIIGEISSKKSSISVAENDILHNQENIERIKGEIAQVDIDAVDAVNDIELKRNKIKELQEFINEKKELCEQSTDNLNDIILKTGRNGDQIQILNSKLSSLTAQSADARVIQMTSASSIAELKNKIDDLLNTIALKKEQYETTLEISNSYKTKIEEIDNSLQSLSNMIRGLEIKIENYKEKQIAVKNNYDKLNLDTQEQIRKVGLLEDLEKNLEGFSYAVKTVMKNSTNGVLKGIHGPVSRIINVPTEYAVAVEIALGATMQNIVTSTDLDAKNAIAYLKKVDGGRATFLPMNTVKSKDFNEKNVDDCYGFIGMASDLCNCKPEYQEILQSLLGRIVVAEDLNCATQIAKKYGFRFKIVTLDGQVVNAGGSLTGGSLGRKSGLLSRTVEISKGKEKIEKLKVMLQQAEKDVENINALYAKTEGELLGLKGEYSNVKQEQIRVLTEAKACENDLVQQNEFIKASEDEVENCKNKIDTLKSDEIKSKQILSDINVSIGEYETEIQKITGIINDLTDKRENLSLQMQNIKLEIVTAEKDIESLNAEIAYALSSEKNRDLRKSELLTQIEMYNNKIEETKKSISLFSAEIERLNNIVKSFNEKIEDINNKKSQLELRNSQLRNSEKETLNEKELSGGELARLEERKINLEKEYESIISRLWEEYQLTKNEAQESAIVIENISESQKRLNELKSKIRGLGNVNVSAIEEYKEVSERYNFMSEQVEDVEKSKKEILRLIIDLTKQMQEEFIKNFEEINRNFTFTFKELFGGGTASLALTDPQDILSSGIDIIVHPPGKIVVHLDALSGGEKALVAIALYFAIMKVRPAPFCVMDEIEAALDDVNVDRFAQYIRNLTHKTQFILITHRRGTMEESDVLYGVTMQDEGVSKLLELRASEIATKLGI